MNYMVEILAFHNSLLMNDLSTGQIALWYALMFVNNDCNWIEWFSATNKVISIQSGLSKSGIENARNVLKQKGYIDFKPRGTKATLYKIIPRSNSGRVSGRITSQDSDQDTVQDSDQDSRPLNKLKNEIKKKDTNVSKESDPGKVRHKRGEYGHVLLSDDEIYRLSIDYDDQTVQAAIKLLDEYMQMNGKTYKDCNLAIRKWVISAVQERQPKKPLQSVKPNQFHNFNQRDTDYDAMILQGLQDSNNE